MKGNLVVRLSRRVSRNIPHVSGVFHLVVRLSMMLGTRRIVMAPGTGRVRGTAVTEFVNVETVLGAWFEALQIRHSFHPVPACAESHDSLAAAARRRTDHGYGVAGGAAGLGDQGKGET
jgi:hypothetical protein